MKYGIHEVAGGVSRKRPAGAIGAVSTRREAEDNDPSLRIAEAGDGLPPIFPVYVGAPFFPGDLLAVGDQARTAPAGDNLAIQVRQPDGERPEVGALRNRAPFTDFAINGRTGQASTPILKVLRNIRCATEFCSRPSSESRPGESRHPLRNSWAHSRYSTGCAAPGRLDRRRL